MASARSEFDRRLRAIADTDRLRQRDFVTERLGFVRGASCAAITG